MDNTIVRTDRPLFADRLAMNRKVAAFWNQLSESWSKIWGPHIHHGFYEENVTLSPLQAQEKLIEKLIQILPLQTYLNILDVGCGMGGTSLFLADKYQANVTGITLSPKQVFIANNKKQEMNIKNVSFRVDDALSLKTIDNETVDLVWSLESCEQFFDKDQFIKQAFRVLKPGGKIMLATWCSDKEIYQGKSAKQYQTLCHAFDLPYMPTMLHYQQLLSQNKLHITNVFDWSSHVEKSWQIGRSLANAYSFIRILKMSGWRGWHFRRQIKLMQQAFAEQRVKYGVFVATKAE